MYRILKINLWFLIHHYHIEVVNELTRRRTNFGPPKRSDKQIKTKVGISCNVLDTWLHEERYDVNILLINEEWIAAFNKDVIKTFDYVIVKSIHAKKILEKYNIQIDNLFFNEFIQGKSDSDFLI